METSEPNKFQRFMSKPSTIIGAIVAIAAIAIVPSFISASAEAETVANAEPTFLKACNGGEDVVDGQAPLCHQLIVGYIMGHSTTVKLAEIRAGQQDKMYVEDNKMFCPTDENTTDQMYQDVLDFTAQNKTGVRNVMSMGSSSIVNVLTIVTKALMVAYPCPQDSEV